VSRSARIRLGRWLMLTELTALAYTSNTVHLTLHTGSVPARRRTCGRATLTVLLLKHLVFIRLLRQIGGDYSNKTLVYLKNHFRAFLRLLSSCRSFCCCCCFRVSMKDGWCWKPELMPPT